MALVVVAADSRVEHKAGKVALYEHLYTAPASPDYSDARSGEFVECPLAHIARQHHLYAHIVECRSDVALTTTALW